MSWFLYDRDLCHERVNATSRSSHWKYSMKRDVLKNFAKYTGKHLCQSLFFNNVAGLRPVIEAFNFIKKETLALVFYCVFCENTPILKNICERMLLDWSISIPPETISVMKWVNYIFPVFINHH